jgi:hypothetical protein
MGAYDYLFDCPDSDEENYDPSRECFHVEVDEIALMKVPSLVLAN